MSYGYQGYGRRGPSGDPGFGIGARLIPILIGLIAVGVTMARGCQQGPFGRAQVVAINSQQESATRHAGVSGSAEHSPHGRSRTDG